MYANFTLGLALSNNYARQYTISFELYSHKVTLSIEIFARFIYILHVAGIFILQLIIHLLECRKNVLSGLKLNHQLLDL